MSARPLEAVGCRAGVAGVGDAARVLRIHVIAAQRRPRSLGLRLCGGWAIEPVSPAVGRL